MTTASRSSLESHRAATECKRGERLTPVGSLGAFLCFGGAIWNPIGFTGLAIFLVWLVLSGCHLVRMYWFDWKAKR